MLTDALDTPIAIRLEWLIQEDVKHALNRLIYTYNIIGRPDFLFHAQPLTDAPKNAHERRECAVAVLVAKWRWQEDAKGIEADLADMDYLGRTDRWHNAIVYAMNLLEGDPEYALMQGSVYLNHAA